VYNFIFIDNFKQIYRILFSLPLTEAASNDVKKLVQIYEQNKA